MLVVLNNHISEEVDSMGLPSPQVMELLKKVQTGSTELVGQTEPMDPPSQTVREVLKQFGFQN